jgi:2-polyprenyl-3-methyl-5-hydroxy-6-metoxy-1,4-benzoquinol methylase
MTTPDAGPVNPDRLLQFAWGYAPLLIIHAALHHRVFDRLQPEPRSLAWLTAETGASARGLGAILDALVGLQLLAREGDSYALTPESAAFLVSSRPDYRGPFFDHHVNQLLPPWQQLADVVRTGRPVARTNEPREGGAYFARFVESLFPGTFPAAQALGEHLGIPRAAAPVSVLDVGAGSGVWGIALAKQSPHVRIRAVDWPAVLEVTRKVAARHGVADRLSTAAGDMFAVDFGRGHQVAVLGHILHSEGPDRCRRLLQKVHEALSPGGLVAIQEFVPDDDRTGPPQALIFAVNMLVNTEAGGTYTFAELSRWLGEAGFRDPRRLEVPGPAGLVLADRPRQGTSSQ